MIFIVTTPLVSLCMERWDQVSHMYSSNTVFFKLVLWARKDQLTRIFWSWSTVWLATLFPLISAISSPSCKDPEKDKPGATDMFEFKGKHENHSATAEITHSQINLDLTDVILFFSMHFGDSSKHNTCDYLVCGSSLHAVFWPQSSVASHWASESPPKST